MTEVKLEPSWLARIGSEFELPYMQDLKAFLQAERAAGKSIYPVPNLWFNALDSTPFDQVKVVILGQDPYHGPGQAHGLCFSVPVGVEVPPSLKNIYKELESDIGLIPPNHGCLESWSKQGVLMLNATLTVAARNAGSHQNQGWERLTDAIIESLNTARENLVFILWGSYAQKKGANIDSDKHLVLRAPHPSPLSSYRGFFGSKPFSQTNKYLVEKGVSPINWQP